MSYQKAQLMFPQLETVNGVPAEGYTVNSYIWDTSTPLAMYTSSTGSGAATSFSLNSAGITKTAGGTPCDIFLDTTKVYKFIIKDAAGAQFGPTIGPVYGSGLSFDTSLIVDTVDDMAAFTSLMDGQLVLTSGYYEPFDGGANEHIYDQNASETGNGGTIITPDTLSGRFKARYQNQFDVLRFGAKRFGSSFDSTLKIRAAIEAAIDYVQSGNHDGNIFEGFIYAGTAPEVWFPAGVYYISDYLTPDTAQYVSYLSFGGEGAVLILDAGVTAFGGIGYNTKFSRLIIQGGASAISLKTSNTDTTTITIDQCEFHEQTDSQIKSDTNSNSTILNLSRSKLIDITGGGKILHLGSIDQANISDCWMHCGSALAIYNNATKLNIDRVIAVPTDDMVSAGGRWFDNYGYSLNIHQCRFGGEDGGAPLVFNHRSMLTSSTDPYLQSSITVKDSLLYCGSSGRADRGVIVAKTGLPSIINFENNEGPSASYIINDQMLSGTLLTWFNSLESTISRPNLSINISNTDMRTNSISSSDALTARLQPYMEYSLPDGDTYKYFTKYFPRIYSKKVESSHLKGTLYPVTSTSGTNLAIVDTGIYYNTDDIGYGQASMYEVFIKGNTLPAGSGSYRAVSVGYVIIVTGFSGVVSQTISYQELINVPPGGGPSAFTVTAKFWNGSVEATSVANGNTSNQIRIKIDGYGSAPGSSTSVFLVKRG